MTTARHTTEAAEAQQPTGAATWTTFVYSVDHDVHDLAQVVEGLRIRGILTLPSVGTSYMMADSNAWESPAEDVAVRTKGGSDVRPRRVMLPGEYTSLGEYIDALARAVLDEPEQCAADACTASVDAPGSYYCSDFHAAMYEGGVDR